MTTSAEGSDGHRGEYPDNSVVEYPKAPLLWSTSPAPQLEESQTGFEGQFPRRHPLVDKDNPDTLRKLEINGRCICGPEVDRIKMMRDDPVLSDVQPCGSTLIEGRIGIPTENMKRREIEVSASRRMNSRRAIVGPECNEPIETFLTVADRMCHWGSQRFRGPDARLVESYPRETMHT
ncbi:hypothetical protein CPB85DRAFT_1252524 [Mucidula mucida]|nr:hypothetical protein CPB85DRAFT_1252524 [Mucidula mucida]